MIASLIIRAKVAANLNSKSSNATLVVKICENSVFRCKATRKKLVVTQNETRICEDLCEIRKILQDYEGLRWLHLRSKYNRATTLCASKNLSAQHPAKPGDTKHPDRPWQTSGRQVSLLGAKPRHVGDKCEIMRPEHSEHQSTQSIQSLLGDKWETNGTQVQNHAARALRASRAYWETSGRQV